MNFIVSILIGGLLGWVVSLFWGTSERQGIILNVVVGVVGVVLARWMLDSLLELSTFNQAEFGLAGLLVSLLAAFALLAAMQMLGGIHLKRPVADNESEGGRQQNRRVEVIIENPPPVVAST